MKNKQTNKKLTAYASLGAAFLAANPQPMDAAIIYTDIPDLTVTANPSFVIGIDFDGQTTASNSTSFNASLGTGPDIVMGVVGAGTTAFLAGSNSNSALIVRSSTYQGPLASGFNINYPGPNFASYAQLQLVNGTNMPIHPGWNPSGTTGFIGVNFLIGGQPHNGWARISVNFPDPATRSITLHDFCL